MEKLADWALDRGSKYFYLVDNLRSLETKLQRLRNRKIDFESKVKDAERSGTKKRKREVENWFDEVAKIENEFVALKTSIQEGGFLENAISSGKRVEKMDEIVEQLMGQSDSDHFGELCLEASEGRGEPLEITELFGEMFRKGLETITAWLDTNEILRIGIWGMGGVGKTTLAEHIHNHLLKNTQSFRVYWVSVSQEFTIKGLQGDVAKRLGLDLSHEDDEKVRARKLRDAFEKMKEMVVLMLDDVWEEFRLNSLGIDARNCRLILTTRLLQVCNQMRCHPFELKTLDTEEAWGLFERTLGNELEDGDLKDTAKSVAKRCGGLPLGIVVMAGSMIGVTDIREWRNALVDLNRVEHGKMEDKVFRILERSFNCLDKYERNCFLYCCLYPEDRKIRREGLIDLFISAELMSKRESWSEEFDQGHTILNKLIRVCLLEKTTNFMTGDYVKMHDLVRDMALRITHGKSNQQMNGDVPRFLVKSIGKGNSIVTQNWTEDLRAVSFYFRRIEIPPDWSPNCPKLSTLLLSDVSIEEIPDSFFRHMCGLKVLNLSRCEGITKLPNSVSDLVNLTALILGCCVDLRSVPPLGKLKQLRDLDLSSTKIQDLPEGWESLVNLERLNLNNCSAVRQKIIPKGTLSQFHRLQRLLLPRYGRVQVNESEVLNQLESFTGYLSLTNFYKITRWPKYYHVYINDISTEGPFYKLDHYEDRQQLHFHQCKLGRGSNYLPDDMKNLIIEECEGMGIRCLSDVFKNFINLSHLSKLEITDSVGIEFLWQLSSAAPRDQLEVSSFSPLCHLDWLGLKRLPNLVGLFYGESEPSYLLPAGTFSSLKIFWIDGCHDMKQLFTVQLLQSLQNLRVLHVGNCEGLEEIAADGNGVGQGGGEGTQLTSSEGATGNVIILPKLRRLSLDNLPQLKNICKAAMICDSIYEIAIFNCPNLKRLPLFLSTIGGPPSLPSTLHKIRGDKEWWESLEWDYPSAKKDLDPYFTTE